MNGMKAESFLDVGYDGEANTGDEGEGDGKFNFRDYGIDGAMGNPHPISGDPTPEYSFGEEDGIHQKEEPSEPFIDFDFNENKAYDFEVLLLDGVIEEHAETAVNNEVRHIIDTYSDDDPNTLEFFAVGSFKLMNPETNEVTDNTRGIAYNKNADDFMDVPNAFFSTQKAIGYKDESPRDFIVNGHEIGHILLNENHYGEQYTVTVNGRKKEINLMRDAGDKNNTVLATKRLEKIQCNKAYNFFKK